MGGTISWDEGIQDRNISDKEFVLEYLGNGYGSASRPKITYDCWEPVQLNHIKTTDARHNQRTSQVEV